MNISPLTIYLWQLADTVRSTVGPLCFLSGVMLLIGFGYFIICRACKSDFTDDEFEGHQKYSFRLLLAGLVSFVCCLTIYVATPTSKTIAMMVIIPEIAHSKAVQQDLPDIYNAAVEALKSALKQP